MKYKLFNRKTGEILNFVSDSEARTVLYTDSDDYLWVIENKWKPIIDSRGQYIGYMADKEFEPFYEIKK